MLKLFIIPFLFICFSLSTVFAYPHYIGHGYNSCITCHANPMGNGPLNDYGRAFGATAVASRAFENVHKPEEKIGEQSGFFFQKYDQSFFRPFIGYRGMLLKRNFGKPNEETEYINMQLDATAQFKYGEKDQWIASYTFGYTPIPRSLKNTPQAKTMDEYKSREHYVGFREANWGVYVGLLDKPFGIRLVEHSAYSRTTPLLNMNDQSHGVMAHLNSEWFEVGVNTFVGNLSQEKSLRQVGASTMMEFNAGENFRPGISLLTSENDFLKMNAKAIHIRSSMGKGHSLMSEWGVTNKESKVAKTNRRELYGFLQGHLRADRGLYVLNSLEYYKKTSEKNYKVRFGPSVQYFPINRVELRADLYNTRTFSTEKSSPDTWDFLGQVHLWF